MDGQKGLVPEALSARREGVVGALTTSFAGGGLNMDEFELRLDLAYGATSLAELDALLADLSPVRPTAGESAATIPAPAAVPVETRRARGGRVLTIMSSTQRKGSWHVPRRMRVVSLMGAVELDFREATFGPGVTEVRLRSVMAAISIVVPPGLRVECDGVAILGHFEGLDQNTGAGDPSAPLLHISGVAIMASVEISAALPDNAPRLEQGATAAQIGPAGDSGDERGQVGTGRDHQRRAPT